MCFLLTIENPLDKNGLREPSLSEASLTISQPISLLFIREER